MSKYGLAYVVVLVGVALLPLSTLAAQTPMSERLGFLELKR